MPSASASYELDAERKEDRSYLLRGDPANIAVYDPLPASRVPVPGAWVLITRKLPAIEGAVDAHVRVGRIFFVEHLSNADAAGFLPNGSYKVILHSPWGDVQLWPYEYSVIDVDALIPMWTAGEILFHPTNIDDARFTDVAFYARSRGIGLADAAVMALGSLSGSVGWFEPQADLAEVCESMERRVHHPWPVRVAPHGGRDLVVKVRQRQKKAAKRASMGQPGLDSVYAKKQRGIYPLNSPYRDRWAQWA